ncbi:DUF3800 domain-containing protein [Bosea vaviloviae]|uniref:DUF3800 domain-containing protein n=1 Tax=Bosea vaviloviae TaxID=1526658 RepID=A0A1D7U4A7_9HYPH|nr:DUF3800 domain-containing protein [Bosea vaviloviae]AOO82213.1 hypothetical protein BHK69_18780 [Bosea vaviloviae]
MPTIYFDESGQTGTNLLDRDQPFFAIGSTDLAEEEATGMLARHFGSRQGKELKANRLLGQARGRRECLPFLDELGGHAERVCGARIHKRFTVVAKMVDHLVEPVIRDRGYDFYAGDYAAKFANTTYLAFDSLLPSPDADRLMGLYHEFAREPDQAGLSRLHHALRSVHETAQGICRVPLALMIEGSADFEPFADPEGFSDTNDVHVTAVVQCMGHWQSRHAGPFDVVHDESVHFFRRSHQWRRITDPALAPEIIQVGDRSMKLPIAVISTESARSHESASLQVCDLVAGIIGRFRQDEPPGPIREFYEAAIASGLGRISVFPVEPGTEFVSGMPAIAQGPDAIDRIVMAVNRPRRGK